MNIKCENLLELKCFQQIKLIAGRGGLGNTITWVYINQDKSLEKWVHGGEIVFITGMCGAQCSEETLVRFINECIENAVAGVVILCNDKFIKNIPESAIKIADEGNLPLFEMPWNLKLVDVTKEIADTIIMNQLQEKRTMEFFSELLFVRHISEKTVKYMGIYCGADVEKDAVIMIIHPIYLPNDNEASFQRREYDNLLSLFRRNLEDYFYSKQKTYISCIYMDEILIYVNCDEYSETVKMRKDIEKLSSDFINKHGNIQIYGGIGHVGKNLEEVRQSYNEARQALAISEKKDSDCCLSLYSELGVIRLLVNYDNQKELKKYCRCTLKALIDSDNLHHTEYVITLKAYLICNCNLKKAAEMLFIHRNTMVYRIEKIRRLMGIDFNDMVAKSECMNALRIMEHFDFELSDLSG